MGGSHHFIDAGGENRRLLVALDGRVKLVLLVAALLVNLTAGGLRVPPLLFVTAFALVLASGLRVASFARRMVIPAVLALVAFLTQLFWVRQGAVLWNIDLHLFRFVVHQGGLQRGLELAVRILGGMGVLLFFSLTTPLPELMRAARFFRCPPVLVELALIMYRYIFLLLEEGGASAPRRRHVSASSTFAAGSPRRRPSGACWCCAPTTGPSAPSPPCAAAATAAP